ncbi:transmembrane protease serine 9-like [Vanessa atalanta]|uniref:transmembrane protease serine 9-like n=1 Tax=Vanessa atalanta TaxID=42275 RepID=UPI001FCDD7E9|nr:transmembrane protease serine 9-like [Vanessa atalanta]
MWNISAVLLLFTCCGTIVHCREIVDSKEENITISDVPNGEDKFDKNHGCNCRCGERNEASRIVGGVETAVNEFPWVARLTYFNKFYCGGMLINDRYVLTAAHCVKGLMWFMIKVTLGEHNRCNETHRPETRFVVNVVAHNFTYLTFRDDIALLKLNEKVEISDTIKPVCLPRSDDNQYEGVKAIAVGWGSVGEQKNHSCNLLDVELPVLSNKECRNTKYESAMIADDMLCAGYPKEGKRDTCQGDSGGPLSAERGDKRYELLGVVSWGIGCGRQGYPGVYTRVTKYLDWIKNNSRNGCFCSINGSKSNHSCECGIAGKNRRIVGGTTVQPHQYPWLVALMLGSKLHCGGAIITDQHILTAGHCITFGVHYRDLSAHIGMHDRLGSSHSVMHLSKGVKHPSFTSNAVRDINDIAVLTLEKKLKFSDKVRPICLPSEDMIFGDLPLTVAGWGKTRQGALTSSRYLLETRVKLVMSHVCTKSSIYKDNFVSDTMMCAYSLGKDACQGDSGGPIFATHSRTHHKKWYQVGIVSWGIDCAKPDYPGVYTIVAKYIPWIKQQTVGGLSCDLNVVNPARLLLGTDSIHSRTPRSVVITRKVKKSNVASYNINHLLYGECGRPSDEIISVRIVGGRRAEPHSFPWTVAIMKMDKLHCGGAIITDRHILTAGHCFKWDDVKLLTVLMGLDNIEHLEDVEKRSISKTVIHEDFTTTAVRDENDIAIATINKPVKFSKTIIPICLPDSGQDFSERVGTVVGWGRLGVDKSSSKVLMKASLRILNDEDCMNSKLSTHLKPTMMCASSKGKDGCQGDSGGPLIVFEGDGRYVQAGVVSWGIGCADPRYPGVYTKVSNYIDWIKRHTADGSTCD